MDSNDYTFVEGHEQEQWTIKLKTGDFKDTYYQYGKIKIVEPCDNSDPKINFTYHVLDSTYDIDGLNGNEKFLYHIGDDQARSCMVMSTSGLILLPVRIASQVVQRQVGFSNTLT